MLRRAATPCDQTPDACSSQTTINSAPPARVINTQRWRTQEKTRMERVSYMAARRNVMPKPMA